VGDRPGHAARLDRDDVVAMLASFGSQPVEGVPDRIDSMELAWLLHQVEQRYGVRIELDDGQVGRMDTVTGAVDVLREAIAAQARG
jgi:hypothetical protein